MTSAVVTSDSAERIERDIICFRCYYNLRGAAAGGDCPECGASVGETLRRRAAHGDPRWLRRVLRGVDLILFPAALGVGALLVVIPLYGHSLIGAIPLMVTFGATGFLLILFWIGVWLVTSAEPGANATELAVLMRWTARITCLALALVPPALAALRLLVVTVSDLVGSLILFTICALAGACVLSFGYCLRSVLRRAGKPEEGGLLFVLAAAGGGLLLSLTLIPPLMDGDENVVMRLVLFQFVASILLGIVTFFALIVTRGALSALLRGRKRPT